MQMANWFIWWTTEVHKENQKLKTGTDTTYRSTDFVEYRMPKCKNEYTAEIWTMRRIEWYIDMSDMTLLSKLEIRYQNYC